MMTSHETSLQAARKSKYLLSFSGFCERAALALETRLIPDTLELALSDVCWDVGDPQ